MDLEIAGEAAIVTGGASHIGRAIVLELAKEGVDVAVLDYDADQSERTVQEAVALGGGSCHAVEVDLTRPDMAAAAVAEAAEKLGRLDIVVNNVGGGLPAFFLDITHDQLLSELALNLIAPVVVTRAALPILRQQGKGSVITISSVAAWGEPRTSTYGASKAALNSLMRSLAKEYGRDSIRFNTVAPGAVSFDGSDEAIGDKSIWLDPSQVWNSPDQLESVRRSTPLRALASPDDIARSVAFLASDAVAGRLTGQVLSVSGGFAMPW